ncbi:ATP-grasp domain-containing protein [Streptosporangium sp. H16]|uniref:ATP-grasp domain-containing protein n=1 Tax=Streptosporangium sp. H16 TaxID=3444184 RepID=UPI003F79102F
MMNGHARIALVTARPRPEVNTDWDMPLLHTAFDHADATAEIAAWDDPHIDWAGFDLAVIRSPWDYSWRSSEFLAWVDRCSEVTQLANPPEIIQWNSRKQYLLEMYERNVPIVPTRYIVPGDPINLPRDHEFVVKPAVGAGARFAARYQPIERERATAHAERIHTEGVTVMVQPYLTRIDVTGERALVFVRNRFLHAIRKKAVLPPGLRYDEPRDAHPGTEPWEPTPAEMALAERALAAVPEADKLLYARVDMADGEAGDPVMTELELVEPGLYLRFHQESIPTFVNAIVEVAKQSRALRESQSII